MTQPITDPKGFPPDMDPECLPLCVAMNKIPGVTTHHCCCGHGQYPFEVWFTVTEIAALTSLTKALGQDCPDWKFEIYNAERQGIPVLFHLESTRVGATAYQAAVKLETQLYTETK